ncbi:helix-turn-helix domain-containing protein [Neobacillus sp. OS1-33]|jgi:hypothetical protein|uniref:PucR family transcriptional regulator n=1 Tax=Neobacillus sp. OS1-33 TaxID=3070683 RepID=UPI0027E05569|nr:helix-turn-helix domain-containing protein [Neobacillus sp. OS1-33]WML27893.1 helix-turn-helix domain-containing protein [Neobacillus sp. OS1-33]
MLKKLLSIYKNSILFPDKPVNPSEQSYLFFNEVENEWISIPKGELTEKELTLLKTLYQLIDFQTPTSNSTAKGWDLYLFSDGPLPNYKPETYLRFIQIQLNSTDAVQTEIESALKGFFSEEVIIIWENNSRGIVIEKGNTITLTDEELISMTETLESDLYIKISFFIGKFHPISDQLRSKFLGEKEYFSFGLANLITNLNILTFERIFPAYLAYHLPPEIKQRVIQVIFRVFKEDHELYSTIKVFLENNLNASLTAKKLYIHRNTLQYRIDKFIDKTGIQLKDFYGAFTVFLACLLFEQSLDK